MFSHDSAAEELERSLIDADGHPRRIERIEIQPRPWGEFHWSVWSEGVEIFTTDLPATSLALMLNVSHVLLQAAMGTPPPVMASRAESN